MVCRIFAFAVVGVVMLAGLGRALPIVGMGNNLPIRGPAMQAGQVIDTYAVPQVGSRDLKREDSLLAQPHGLPAPAPAAPVKPISKNGAVAVDWNWSLSTQF